ncbi:hypothetical protein [Nocardia sp. NPDC047038]|uniref:hypothetical protein n=1 Tax=Nocardia sp. NPDC047038 TaxID=3154338 RepID=UPI0033BFDD81
MLHDIELENPQPNRCFAVRGAEHAAQLLGQLDVPADRVALIRDGIAGHMTLGADSDLSDLAGALAAGAGVDLFGNRIQELDPQWIAEIISRHPRLDFKRLVIAAVRARPKPSPTDEPRSYAGSDSISWSMRRRSLSNHSVPAVRARCAGQWPVRMYRALRSSTRLDVAMRDGRSLGVSAIRTSIAKLISGVRLALAAADRHQDVWRH